MIENGDVRFLNTGGVNEKKDLFSVPVSPQTDLVMKALNTGGNLSRLLPRSKTQKCRITQDKPAVDKEGNRLPQKVTVEIDKESGSIELNISDVMKLAGYRKGVKKALLWVLIKIGQQVLSIGGEKSDTIRQDYVSFPLSEIVEAGLYKNEKTARRGFENSIDALTSFKVGGRYVENRGKKQSIETFATEVIFTGGKVKGGQCVVYLNTRINWGFLAQYFTILPKFSFALNTYAFDLMYTIFYLARQRGAELLAQGFFPLKMRTLQERLGLPSEKDNRSPKKTIIEPILSAIQEVQEALESRNIKDLKIEAVYNHTMKIHDFLDEGRVVVSLTGDYAKNFAALAQKKAQIIEARKEKDEKRTDEAMQKAADKIAEEEMRRQKYE